MSLENLILRKDKLTSQRGTLSPGKRFQLVRPPYRMKVKTRPWMGHWWAGPHLDRHCFDVHILSPLLKLYSHFRVLNVGESLDLFVCLLNVITINNLLVLLFNINAVLLMSLMSMAV